LELLSPAEPTARGDSSTRKAAVTARHYAAWVVEDGYRNPLQVAPGELPTDLFAQFELWRATTTPPNATTVRNITKIKEK
jgi:hypothetical protein